MKEAILIFLGGGLGSLFRFGVSKWVGTLHTHYFPFGTLAANVLACFALGVILGLADARHLLSHSSKLFWTIGFCGGFSTFSTFSGETISLFQSGFTLPSILYVTASLVLCIAAVLGGLFLSQGS